MKIKDKNFYLLQNFVEESSRNKKKCKSFLHGFHYGSKTLVKENKSRLLRKQILIKNEQ